MLKIEIVDIVPYNFCVFVIMLTVPLCYTTEPTAESIISIYNTFVRTLYVLRTVKMFYKTLL